MEYVSIYKRPDSPFWWLAYVDPITRKRKYRSTGFRIDSVGGYKRALSMAGDCSRETKAAGPVTGAWEDWVPGWISLKHRNVATSLHAENGRWKWLRVWLHEHGIQCPAQLTYQQAIQYIEWRTAQVKRTSGKHPKFNTALAELRLLSRIMREAVRRAYIGANPIERLGIGKDPAPEKPEMTDREIRLIREKLVDKPEWMRVSFEIALHQGCRLRETRIPWSRIDWQRSTVQFLAKRGKMFTTVIHPQLVPMLRELQRDGKTHTLEWPAMPTKDWHLFFKEIGLPHLCFHCTRVTAVTRMARAGVPIQQAMAYVGHANETIHRVYMRLQPADAQKAILALKFESPRRDLVPDPHDPSCMSSPGAGSIQSK